MVPILYPFEFKTRLRDDAYIFVRNSNKFRLGILFSPFLYEKMELEKSFYYQTDREDV